MSRGPGRWQRAILNAVEEHGAVLVRQLVQAETGSRTPPRAAEVAALRAARTLPDSYGLALTWWHVCRRCLYPQTDHPYWCQNPRCSAKYGDLTTLTVVRYADRSGRLSVANRRNVWQHIKAGQP
jgi:hypothetical protein